MMGAVADLSGRRKYWLAIFTAITIFASAGLWFAYPNPDYAFLTLFMLVLGTLGLEIGMVFYNAMLPGLSPKNMIGRVSGWAWGFGYFGGLAALSLCLALFVFSPPAWLDQQSSEQIRICGPFIALWLLVFSLPIFIWVPDIPRTSNSFSLSIKLGMKDLWMRLKNLPKERNIFIFLIAHMIFADGLNTMFAFGGIYAAGTFHMTLTQVIELGILLNIAAGVGAISFAWLDDFWGPIPTIFLSLTSITLLGIGLVLVVTPWQFVLIATVLSLFFGPVQSASRSLMARLVPPDRATEYFGLYAFSGKVTTFIGPWILAEVTLHFQSQRAGVATILLFFIAGGALLRFVKI